LPRLLNEITHGIRKEFIIEWRQRYALNGLLLYLVCIIFICYMSFNIKNNTLSISTWNALFWVIILFTIVNSATKSFSVEHEKRWYLYYQLLSPSSVMASKMIYNAMLSVSIAIVTLFFYAFVMGNPVQDLFLFVVNMLLGSVGISCCFTMIGALASKAQNSHTLTAVLGFPVILPLLLLIIKISKHTLDGLERSLVYDEMLTITAIISIIVVTALLLFPFVWKE